MDEIGLLEKIFGKRKENRLPYYASSNGFVLTSTKNGTKTKSDTIQAAINTIALHASKIKLKHVHKGKDVTYLEKLLNGYPNPYMPSQQFLYRWIANTLMHDNGWVYPQYDFVTGRYIAFWVLDPQNVTLKRGNNNSLWVQFTFGIGNHHTLPYESLLHLRNYFMKDDILGGVDNTAFNESLTDYMDAKKSIANATKVSSRIIATLEVDEMLNDEDRSKALQSFNKYIEDSKNGNSIFVQDLKGKLNPMNLSPKMAAGQQLESLKKDVLQYIPVSESIVRGNYTEEEFNSFYETILEPIFMQVSQVASQVLFTQGQRDNGNKIVAKADLIQYASWKTKLAIVNTLKDIRGIKIGDVREMFGFEFGDDGDEYMQSLNYVEGSKVNNYQGVGNGKEEDDEQNVEE